MTLCRYCASSKIRQIMHRDPRKLYNLPPPPMIKRPSSEPPLRLRSYDIMLSERERYYVIALQSQRRLRGRPLYHWRGGLYNFLGSLWIMLMVRSLQNARALEWHNFSEAFDVMSICRHARGWKWHLRRRSTNRRNQVDLSRTKS